MLNYQNSEFLLAVPELSFVIYKVKMASFCLNYLQSFYKHIKICFKKGSGNINW